MLRNISPEILPRLTPASSPRGKERWLSQRVAVRARVARGTEVAASRDDLEAQYSNRITPRGSWDNSPRLLALAGPPPRGNPQRCDAAACPPRVRGWHRDHGLYCVYRRRLKLFLPSAYLLLSQWRSRALKRPSRCCCQTPYRLRLCLLPLPLS